MSNTLDFEKIMREAQEITEFYSAKPDPQYLASIQKSFKKELDRQMTEAPKLNVVSTPPQQRLQASKISTQRKPLPMKPTDVDTLKIPNIQTGQFPSIPLVNAERFPAAAAAPMAGGFYNSSDEENEDEFDDEFDSDDEQLTDLSDFDE